jgi:antitoxin VapB
MSAITSIPKPTPGSKVETGSVSRPAVKTAKLFKNGRSQAVRLPKEFRFEGTEVAIRRDPATGDVVLTPNAEERKSMSWEELFAVWDSLGAADLDFERHVSYPVERDFF